MADTCEILDQFLQDDLKEIAINLMLNIYRGSSTTETLGQLRLKKFYTMTTKCNLRPLNLPPTTGAAHSHTLRAYLQFFIWRKLCNLPTSDENPNSIIKEMYGFKEMGREIVCY